MVAHCIEQRLAFWNTSANGCHDTSTSTHTRAQTQLKDRRIYHKYIFSQLKIAWERQEKWLLFQFNVNSKFKKFTFNVKVAPSQPPAPKKPAVRAIIKKTNTRYEYVCCCVYVIKVFWYIFNDRQFIQTNTFKGILTMKTKIQNCSLHLNSPIKEMCIL